MNISQCKAGVPKNPPLSEGENVNYIAVMNPANKPPHEKMPGKSTSGFIQDVDCSDVLNSSIEYDHDLVRASF